MFVKTFLYLICYHGIRIVCMHVCIYRYIYIIFISFITFYIHKKNFVRFYFHFKELYSRAFFQKNDVVPSIFYIYNIYIYIQVELLWRYLSMIQKTYWHTNLTLSTIVAPEKLFMLLKSSFSEVTPLLTHE